MTTGLAWTHTTRDLSDDGLQVERVATEGERQALAAELGIASIEALKVRYRLKQAAGGRVTLRGSLDGHLTQTCVVSLEPVAGKVALELEVDFVPDRPPIGSDVEGTLDDLEAPQEEPMENGVMDIGRIVFEELASGIDPYPRAPGATLTWSEGPEAAARQNPFAALAKLKKDTGSD
jgi:uncharacterized metal-binding protein YceD (DUF177 family)